MNYDWVFMEHHCSPMSPASRPVMACLLHQGPTVSTVERSYVEGLVFPCMLGQKKLTTHVVPQLNTVVHRVMGANRTYGISAALTEQSGRCLDPLPGQKLMSHHCWNICDYSFTCLVKTIYV